MTPDLHPGTRILFTGDSITDCGRREPGSSPLGGGYVRMIAEELAARAPGLTIVNTGISGNRVVDLQARWQPDCLDHRPDVVSIMVGINDTWRRYDSNDPTDVDAFEAGYRRLLTRLRPAGPENTGPAPRLVLMEPFLVPVTDAQHAWREDLDPKIQVVRMLAAEFGATLLHTDAVMTSAADRLGAAAVAADGVHPTEAGHRVLADAWLALPID